MAAGKIRGLVLKSIMEYFCACDVSDGDHIDRLISCLYMALPLFKVQAALGASNSKFLNYLNKHIIPVFDKSWSVSLTDIAISFQAFKCS
ncbi:hypothetical protein CK203_076271 [Vitis vinifera]|uniref:Uncharacterized protein n=1 Tax=Vitis vinifera TaxID=29760 RepID=A0A438E5B5_VITVI|nr:hypothetical protein CK203_076271 [Vitis vinifera]